LKKCCQQSPPPPPPPPPNLPKKLYYLKETNKQKKKEWSANNLENVSTVDFNPLLEPEELFTLRWRTLFLWLGLPSTLIHHENGANFEIVLQTGGI